MKKNRIRSNSSNLSTLRKKFVPPRSKFVPPRSTTSTIPLSEKTNENVEIKKKNPSIPFKRPVKITQSSFKPLKAVTTTTATNLKKRKSGFAAPAFVKRPSHEISNQTNSYLYEVMFCKRSKKKRKKYDDGLLIISSKRKAYLKDMTGKEIAITTTKFETMEEGETFLFGGWEAEVIRSVSEEEYTSGRFFIQNASAPPVTIQRKILPKLKKLPRFKGTTSSATSTTTNSTSLKQPKKKLKRTFDPNLGKWFEKSGSKICLDRFLERRMRPHQIVGTRFLWECLSGNRNYSGSGALLCDEMGLGKTLTTIATSYIMLRQDSNVDKIVIVTPASLVRNWKLEIRKWLGPQRLSPEVVLASLGKDLVKTTVQNFVRI